MNSPKLHTSIILILMWSITAFGQSNGTILIISSAKSRVILDGKELATIDSNKPQGFEVSEGQHYIQVISFSGKVEKNKILEIEAGKQQVLKFEFESNQQERSMDKILIADLDLQIPGIVTASAQENFEYPTYLYAFEKGDEIFLSIDMTNAKGTNAINVFTLPDGNPVYSNDSFRNLKDIKVNVKERGIYGFSFASNHAFDRDARFIIERIPESEESQDFNTAVSRQETYRVVVIQKPLFI